MNFNTIRECVATFKYSWLREINMHKVAKQVQGKLDLFTYNEFCLPINFSCNSQQGKQRWVSIVPIQGGYCS